MDRICSRSRRVGLMVAASLSVGGCTLVHAVGGSATPGEYYLVAQRSVLGIAGDPYVVRCVEENAGTRAETTCERLLTGKDLGELRPAMGPVITRSWPARGASRRGAPRSDEEIARERAETAARARRDPDSAVDVLLGRCYAALGYAWPAAPLDVERDRAAIARLLRDGHKADDIPARLAEAANGQDRGRAVYLLVGDVPAPSVDDFDFE